MRTGGLLFPRPWMLPPTWLSRGKGFSVERLMHFLNALDRDVEILIKKKPRSKRAATIVVTSPVASSGLI